MRFVHDDVKKKRERERERERERGREGERERKRERERERERERKREREKGGMFSAKNFKTFKKNNTKQIDNSIQERCRNNTIERHTLHKNL